MSFIILGVKVQNPTESTWKYSKPNKKITIINSVYYFSMPFIILGVKVQNPTENTWKYSKTNIPASHESRGRSRSRHGLCARWRQPKGWKISSLDSGPRDCSVCGNHRGYPARCSCQGVGGERGILIGGKRVTGSARDLATCKYHALFVDEKENK